MAVLIASIHNHEIKLFRRLQSSRSFREKNGLAVLEGERLLEDAISAGIRLRSLFFTRSFLGKNSSSLLMKAPAGTRQFVLTEELFQRISATSSPQGIAAIFHIPRFAPDKSPPRFNLLLDGLQDPGNLGTICRTAAAAGVDAVYLAPGCVDPFNPKALRASMGGFFRIPYFILTNLDDQVRIWKQQGYRLLAADPGGDKEYFAVAFSGAIVLMIGNEARGLQNMLLQAADVRMRIPLYNRMESLNAAAAAAILIYEGMRQRL